MIKLRWISAAVMVVGTAAAWQLSILNNPAPVLVIAGIIVTYNFLAWIACESVATTPRRERAFWLLQFLADMVALSAAVYYCGGLSSPVVVFYIVHMVCASILLSRAQSYLLATVVLLLFAGAAALQTLKPPSSQWQWAIQSDSWRTYAVEFIAFATATYASVFLATSFTKRLHVARTQALAQRDLMRSIIACMSEAIGFLSPQGKLLLWNPAILEWFPQDLDDQADVLEGPLPMELRQYVQDIKASASPLACRHFDILTTTRSHALPRHFNASASAVWDQAGQHLGYVVVAQDITEQLAMEQSLQARNQKMLSLTEALRRNQQEMAQPQKLAAIGTMAAGVAHEVSNPLASLSAIVQLMERRQQTPRDEADLKNIRDQIHRIATIVRQLLEFARSPNSEKSLSDVGELIEQTVKLVRYSSRSRHATIRFERTPNIPRLYVVAQQFQQVLVNLLLNALDAVSGQSGTPEIVIEQVLDESNLHVKVIDCGVGMNEEQLRKACEPFFTTKPPGEGTGLGLSISHRLVEQQGGKLHLQSTPGKGTTVTVSLPLPAGVAKVTAASPSRQEWMDVPIQ